MMHSRKYINWVTKIDGFKVDGVANIEHAHLRREDLSA